MQTTTLRPGFLVSLKTTLAGNVSYATRDIESDHVTATGERVAKWETERTVADPQEHEAGIKARGKARTAVTRICVASTFGLLCPEARANELQAAIAEAREIADQYNAVATITSLNVNVIVGRVAADDVEAVRAINSEVRWLLDAMETGIKALDVEAVREAANKARAIGQMLTPGAAERVREAVDTVRSAARRMVKAGDQAAQAIDTASLAAIASARTAFLDLDDAPVTSIAMAIAARAIDFDPTDQGQPRTLAAMAPAYDF